MVIGSTEQSPSTRRKRTRWKRWRNTCRIALCQWHSRRFQAAVVVCLVTLPGELPRARQQMYDLKYKAAKTDHVDELTLHAKHKEENIILEHHDVPEDLWVLGKSHICKDLSRFCCSKVLSHPLSVDPTFNFGQYEVTPYSYKHLLLKSKRTKDPQVFIGPTAIHHSKSKAMYPKIESAVYRSSPGLRTEGRGFITDGEKALHDALRESMQNDTGLRFFNHFRQNCKAKLQAFGSSRRKRFFSTKSLEMVKILSLTQKINLTWRRAWKQPGQHWMNKRRG